MTLPRRWILVVRNTRAIRRHIRGQIAERDDSELTDTLPTANPPEALQLLGARGFFQRPRISAPIPSLGGDRLALWSFWETALPQAERDKLDAKETQFPTMVRTLKQQGSYAQNGDFIESETGNAFNARALAAIGWIEQTP